MSLQTWLDDPRTLALRRPARQARRLLDARRLVVPGGCAALVDDPDELLPAGSQRDRLPDLTLVKEALFALELQADGLLDRDGHAHEAHLTLSLFVDTADAAAVRRFRAAFLRADLDDCDTDAVAGALSPAVRDALAGFVGRHGADALGADDVEEAVEHELRRLLKDALHTTGLALSRVRRASFRSPDLERLRAQRAERERAEALEAERQAQLRAAAETDALAAQLQAQVAAEEAARRAELEREREAKHLELAHELQQRDLQHRIALAKQATEQLGTDADLAALVTQVDDPAARERLYALLIQRQMTPEQLAAQAASRQSPAELDDLKGQLAMLTQRLAPAEADAPPTSRLLVACGDAVLAFDPSTNVDPTRPRETYSGADGRFAADLGGVRSVRIIDLPETGRVLLIGARHGAHVVPLDDSKPATAYPIGRAGEARTGINAVARVGDALLATHSGYGLLGWSYEEPALGARDVLPETTRGASAVRGLVSDGERVFYAADNRVYGVGADLQDPRLYSGPVEPVSALVRLGDELFASTVGGAVYAWYVGDPHSPRRLHARRAKIYSLRPLGTRALLLGSKERGVLRVDLVDRRETTYQAGSLVRWAAGARDFVAGVDHDGRSLILWRTDAPEHELRRIPVAEPINDLVILPRT